MGRCNEDELEETLLLNEILAGQYDFCRVKNPSEDEMTSLKLYRTGLPFFFSGSIRRYKTPIQQKPEGNFIHPEMTYEMYNGTQDGLLMVMLRGTWGIYPLGYYRTPFLKELVDKEKEIKAIFKFYKENNINRLHPENSIMFMNHNGNYVGFFALNKIGGGLESHIGGIIEPYRNGGYFLDMLRYIKNFCVDNHLAHFAFGARNENAEVQRIFQYVGFQPIGTENVFHVLPMLSINQVDEWIADVKEDTLSEILKQADIFIQKHFLNYTVKNIQSTTTNLSNSSPFKCIFSIPVKTDSEFLVVVKAMEEERVVKAWYLTGIV
ncbi:MAG: hypothetical protein M9887_02250 [Chitinophagales bacterium]|nr:hypothetical protein [Chitinophagales bacterium]